MNLSNILFSTLKQDNKMTNKATTFKELLDLIDPYSGRYISTEIEKHIDFDAFREIISDHHIINQKLIKYEEIRKVFEKVIPHGTLSEIHEEFIQALRDYLKREDVLNEADYLNSDIVFEQGSDNTTFNGNYECLIVQLNSIDKFERPETDREITRRLKERFEAHYSQSWECLNQYKTFCASIKHFPQKQRDEVKEMFLANINDKAVRDFVINASA